MGDQELMEGTTWESLHIITNYKLNNLILIIDRNNSDFRSIKFIELKNKLLSFCKNIFEVNGNKLRDIEVVLNKSFKKKNFVIIIANTVKGFGLKSTENNVEWHHKVPTIEELNRFKKELNQ